MPPSGYSVQQARHIADFLASCATALEAEAESAGLSPEDGLRKECADIDRVLNSDWSDAISGSVMRLTAQFYALILEQMRESGSGFETAVETSLENVRASVEAAHI
jgi:predicted phage gp36 major capsid-like protein